MQSMPHVCFSIQHFLHVWSSPWWCKATFSSVLVQFMTFYHAVFSALANEKPLYTLLTLYALRVLHIPSMLFNFISLHSLLVILKINKNHFYCITAGWLKSCLIFLCSELGSFKLCLIWMSTQRWMVSTCSQGEFAQLNKIQSYCMC